MLNASTLGQDQCVWVDVVRMEIGTPIDGEEKYEINIIKIQALPTWDSVRAALLFPRFACCVFFSQLRLYSIRLLRPRQMPSPFRQQLPLTSKSSTKMVY